jgi:PAS domain S-box-containing protein
MVNVAKPGRYREYAENIINTLREPLIALDQDLRVVSASRSFYLAFKVNPAETVGRLIYDLGNKQWDIPRLRELLETILPEQATFDDYEVEHDFAAIGHRVMLLNARQIEQENGRERIILLAIEDITERKAIENGLERIRQELAVAKKSADAAHEFAENVINTVREPLISLDQDLRVVSANRSFYEFFQVRAEETEDRLIYDLGNKQWDIPKLRELLENILPEQTTFDDYEVDHYFAAIGQRIMLLNARQIEQAWGKERIILLAFEDITERRQLEDLVAESEFRYRRIFETASDGIVLLEKSQGHIVHANQAVGKMLGYSEADYLGKKLDDIGVPLDTSDFPAIIASLDRNGILNYENVSVKTRDGRNFVADIYMVDRAKLAQCNIRDVSERKLAEKILEEERKFIENALNNLADIFFVVDSEEKLIRWNRTMNAVTGYSDPEIELMLSGDFFENIDNDRVAAAMQMAVGEGRCGFKAQLVTKDGNKIPYEFIVVLLRDAQDRPIGTTWVGRDINDRQKLENQLRHAQKMEAVGTLAGGIAHDFNNILSVILGYGNMVMDTLAAGSPVRKDMQEVLTAADRAANLTRRLLVFTRKEVVEVKPLDINELIRDLRRMLERMISESIEFHLDLADQPLTVLADAGMLEQVLMNMVTNARDALPMGGRLVIATSLVEVDEADVAADKSARPGNYARITVADSGQGMDAETRLRIFEPFFTTKGVGEGTGLGLAVSYGIIKQHDGFIKVYSEPGQGTEFNIYLPVSETELPPARKTAASVPVRGGNETILVAEDDVAMRELTCIVLESFGYKVIPAEDGEDALAKFMKNRDRISLLLLDMVMPKKNGKEVAEAIMKISPGIKVIFSSGYSMDIITHKELAAAGFEFLHKPYRAKELAKKLRQVLDR